MNAKTRRQLRARKRRIEKRLDKTDLSGDCPMISASNIQYEIADRQQAIAAGGIGLIQRMTKVLELDKAINQHVNLFKIYLPYSESDHVLNIAYNIRWPIPTNHSTSSIAVVIGPAMKEQQIGSIGPFICVVSGAFAKSGCEVIRISRKPSIWIVGMTTK